MVYSGKKSVKNPLLFTDFKTLFICSHHGFGDSINDLEYTRNLRPLIRPLASRWSRPWPPLSPRRASYKKQGSQAPPDNARQQ